MATKWFKKELCNNKFFFENAPVPFECQPSNTGVISLDTEKGAKLIAALNDAIAKRKGGIGEIDEATYEAIKKNKTGRVSVAYSPKERLQTIKVPGPSQKQKSAEAAVDAVGTGSGTAHTPPPVEGQVFVPTRGRVLNDADKTNPPGNP